MTHPLLQVDDLGLDVPDLNAPRRWGAPPPPRTLLSGVSFTLPAGGALGVIGESGSGKSTLARALTLLLPPQRGRLRFQGREVAGLQGAALVAYRAQLQLVFQDPMSALNPRRTVGHSIAQPAQALGRLEGRTPAALAAALLDRVGLPAAFASRYPHELSGGQRQRVNIARALARRTAASCSSRACCAGAGMSRPRCSAMRWRRPWRWACRWRPWWRGCSRPRCWRPWPPTMCCWPG